MLVAAKIGTLHTLYKGDLAHISGYVLWTIYQQFLLQDYFMDRLLRLVSSEAAAVTIAGTLFAVAHLPNLVLTAATLVWGIVSRAVPGDIAICGRWDWLRDCWGCASLSAYRMRCITICASGWDTYGIVLCGRRSWVTDLGSQVHPMRNFI